MKTLSLFALVFFLSHTALAQDVLLAGSSQMNIMNGGISVGAVIAIVASWSRNQSIIWAIFHGLLGWFYVIYFVVTR